MTQGSKGENHSQHLATEFKKMNRQDTRNDLAPIHWLAGPREERRTRTQVTVGDKLVPEQDGYGNLDPAPTQVTGRLENRSHWKGD